MLLWDTVWNEDIQSADWALDGGDLLDNAQLITAVTLCLFTDAWAPLDRDIPGDTDDRRGWWANPVDQREEDGEREMGSLIWLYERSALTEETRKGVRDAAEASLQPLLDSGAAARVSVEAEFNNITGHMYLEVVLYSRDGDVLFDQRFKRQWEQLT